MLRLLLCALCQIANRLLGEREASLGPEDEKLLSAARSRDPYFQAFEQRCMQWVYGDDPRHDLERAPPPV